DVRGHGPRVLPSGRGRVGGGAGRVAAAGAPRFSERGGERLPGRSATAAGLTLLGTTPRRLVRYFDRTRRPVLNPGCGPPYIMLFRTLAPAVGHHQHGCRRRSRRDEHRIGDVPR